VASRFTLLPVSVYFWQDPPLFEHADHVQIDKNLDVILRDLRKQ